MKSKLFLLEVIFFSICLANCRSARKLQITNDVESNAKRKHLAFESNRGDSILYYQRYAVIFSYTYKLPRYIFNLLTVDQLLVDSTRVMVKRSSSFYPARLPNGTLSATNADYLKSGYDRGHMVPAGDFAWNKELKDETFFYTNINPQTAGLNRGIWAKLEIRIRRKVRRLSEDACKVTAAVFNQACEERMGSHALCVPARFFKIVYFPSRKVIFAFLFDNTIDNYIGDITEFQVPVDFIEEITGEDFFDLIDPKIETKMESEIVTFND